MYFPYSTKKWLKLGMAAVLTTAFGVGAVSAYASVQADSTAKAEAQTANDEQEGKPAVASEAQGAAKPAAAVQKQTSAAAPAPAAPADAATYGTGEELTLEKAIAQALESNATLVNARIEKENADIDYRLSYPSSSSMPEEMIESLDAAQAKYVTQATKDINKKLNGLQLEQTENKIKLGAQQAYYDLVYALDDLNLKKKSLARAQAQLKVAQAAFDVGTKAKTDVLQAEMGVAGAQAAVVSAESALEVARMNLNDFLGVELDKTWKIVAENKQTAPIALTLDQAQEQAIANRVEVKRAEGELELAELNVELIGKYSALSTYQGRIARNNVEAAKLAIDQQKRAISKEVAQAYYNLNSALKAIEYQKKAVDSAAESYRLTNLRYENGLATTLEVIQAEEELSSRENQYQRAIQNYNLAVVNFETALGN